MLRPVYPVALLCTCLATSAWAIDGGAVLERVDTAAARAQDATLVMDVTVHDGRGGSASRVLKIWQKGDDRRLIKFLEPARLAGVGLLSDADDTLHLYLPAYGKTRRVVGSGRGDAFMGTDFSMDDLARTRFRDEYSAELLEEDDTCWQIKLIPLKPADHAHDHLRMRVRKADALFDRVEFVDGEGQLTRRIEFDDVRPDGGYDVAHAITVSDLESGRSTEAVVREVLFDTGLEDDLFTTRYLMRN
jgi:outer membrane lipoprotein-sorting protein